LICIHYKTRRGRSGNAGSVFSDGLFSDGLRRRRRGGLGAVCIWFAKRFFEEKSAPARKKSAARLDTLPAFLTRQARIFTKNTAAIPNANSP